MLCLNILAFQCCVGTRERAEAAVRNEDNGMVEERAK